MSPKSNCLIVAGAVNSSVSAFCGGPNPPIANAEQWNGSAWTEVGDLNEARIHL